MMQILTRFSVSLPNPVVPDIPLAFKVRAAFNRSGPKMDLIGMYMNAIYAMYDLCLLDVHAIVARKDWSLPNYDIVIDMAGYKTFFAIWGLQRTADPLVREGLYPMVSEMTLNGQTMGHVAIRPRKKLGGGLLEESHETITKIVSGRAPNATLPLGSIANLGAEMDIHQTFEGAKLNPQYVFSTCLKTMSSAARYNRGDPASEISFVDGFALKSELDRKGEPLLKYRHVSKIMRAIADTMVKNDHFGEMNVELWKYGRRIAWGRLQGTPRLADVGENGNGTFVAVS